MVKSEDMEEEFIGSLIIRRMDGRKEAIIGGDYWRTLIIDQYVFIYNTIIQTDFYNKQVKDSLTFTIFRIFRIILHSRYIRIRFYAKQFKQ